MAKKQKQANQRKWQSLTQLALFVGILLFLNILANARIGGKPMYTALDMTEEKRYTLTEPTKELLRELEDVVYIKILLQGEFPAGFKRLQASTQDLLDDFRSVSGLVEYEFENPNEGTRADINARRKTLAEQGITPVNLRVKDVEGTAEKVIYPYAIVYYGNSSFPVNLLENEVPGVPPQVTLNNSISLLEYKFANTIQKLMTSRKPNLLFTEGHGELTSVELADLTQALSPYFNMGRMDLDSVNFISQEVSVLVVPKPTQPFTENDKFKVDQYVMNGGKVVWLVDQLRVSLDSLRGRSKYFPNEYQLNLDDLLFRYGIRIQPNLVLDMQSSKIPLATGMVGNAPQFDLFKYPYHPIVLPRSDHPVVKGLGPVNLKYPSSIDLNVMTKTELTKTPILQTSPNSRVQYIPVELNFEFLRYDLQPEKFDEGSQTVGLLLEGTFPSLYTNRLTEDKKAVMESLGQTFKPESSPTKMAVVSDGDVLRNGLGRGEQAYRPLGYNEFDKYLYANKDFMVNLIEYMMDDNGVIEARGKEVKLRMLDTVRAQQEQGRWQLLNIALPLVFLLLFGLGYNILRRRKYAN
jgi:gliding-associated putative ABC transporter substrate-binding component GldG